MNFRVEDPRVLSPQLNGWFSGFCPSNGIADSLNRKSHGVWSQAAETKKKLEALKNGAQAAEWESLKKRVRTLNDELKNLNIDLEREKSIAAAIGVDTTGLGAWCNGAVSRRKKAEASLRAAEKALGEVKGAMDTLEQQQTQGIKEASVVIEQNQQKITAVKKAISSVQSKIEVYKAERDNKQKEIANTASKTAAGKSDFIGKLKENAPLIIAGTAVAATVIYVVTKKKKKTSAVVA
ncbi:hypothetical protein [Tenacibaculum maritimum]|uniref:hypothetical protein n=1 Tax=Tenacibaculum maritimum TaxID=107401 RepID=UPI0038760420